MAIKRKRTLKKEASMPSKTRVGIELTRMFKRMYPGWSSVEVKEAVEKTFSGAEKASKHRKKSLEVGAAFQADYQRVLNKLKAPRTAKKTK